jgi:cell division protein FtsI (penicillin-binding protein 3)
MSENPVPDKRFIVLAALLSAAALWVIISYGIIMLGPRRTGPARAEPAVSLRQIAGRGPILDRNGRMLAIETRLGNVAVQKDRIEGTGEEQEWKRREMREELGKIAEKLAPALEISPEELFGQIEGSPTDYVSLKKQVSLPAIAVIESIRDEAARLRRSLSGLALDRALGNISVKKAEIQDKEGLCGILAPLLGSSPETLRDRIDTAPGASAVLAQRAEKAVLDYLEALRDDAVLTERSLRRLRLERVWGRIYPEHNLASQIVGFVGDMNSGLEGIEYAFDTELAPAPEDARAGAAAGSSVFLTVDVNVQYILEEIARRALTENKAEAVMLLAMDPRTGDILGSASLPDFDPNHFRNYGEPARMDRPAIWAYEPGSVFKVFSLAALLDAGAIRDDTIFTCNGRYERVTSRGERIVINCLGAHGRVNARDIIIYSCNAGAAYAADRMGTGDFYALLRNYGFGSRTGAGNPETEGVLWPADRWSDRSKPTIAMGQEIAVSALQMIQAASAVANDGILVPPRIVSRIESGDGTLIRSYESGPARQVMRPETARAMRRYMAAVTSDIGTGWRANVEDLSLAVKTGTAQIVDKTTGAYSSTDYIASCIALLPAESPSLILYLAIVKPQGASYLGGRIAAPPIREAAEALINYLGIPRGRNPQIRHPGVIALPNSVLPELSGRVPDFSGYPKRLLLPLLLRDDVQVELSGDGWVRRQNPPPGSPFLPGMTILLELE